MTTDEQRKRASEYLSSVFANLKERLDGDPETAGLLNLIITTNQELSEDKRALLAENASFRALLAESRREHLHPGCPCETALSTWVITGDFSIGDSTIYNRVTRKQHKAQLSDCKCGADAWNARVDAALKQP